MKKLLHLLLFVTLVAMGIGIVNSTLEAKPGGITCVECFSEFWAMQACEYSCISNGHGQCEGVIHIWALCGSYGECRILYFNACWDGTGFYALQRVYGCVVCLE